MKASERAQLLIAGDKNALRGANLEDAWHALFLTATHVIDKERNDTAAANLRADIADYEQRQLQDLLRMRSEALGRTAEQLTEVRNLHAGVPMASRPGDRWCETCHAVWPCTTARAAGMPEPVRIATT